MHGLNHAALYGNSALAGVGRIGEGGDHGLRPGDLGIIRAERSVRRLNLRGVDQGLAVKAERAAGAGFGHKALSVLIGVIHAVQNRHAAGPRRQNQAGEVRLAPRPAGALRKAQSLGQIIRPRHQSGEPEPGALICEGLEIEDGARALDHRPERALAQPVADRGEMIGMVDLGDKDRVGPGRLGAGEVGVQIRAPGLGDSHHGERAGRLESCDRGDGGVARGGLAIRRHGVFQVEHENVGAEPGSLFDRARLIAGHEERGAQRTQGQLVSHGDKAYKTAMSEATLQSNGPRSTGAPRPVIAITSQVAGNPVGGAVTSAVLFHAGFQPVLVPTVVMGRHPGRGAPGGAILSGRELSSALQALLDDGLADRAAAIFTGYVARPDQVDAIAAFLREVRRRRADLPVWVDPILGDGPGAPEESRLYVKRDTAEAVRDQLVGLSDVITPNLFELAWLSGRAVETEAGAITAARDLAPGALVTSAPAGAGQVGVLAVTALDAQSLATPRIDGAPNGAGDLFAALALSQALKGGALAEAAGAAAATVGAAFRASAEAGAAELIVTPDLLSRPAPRPSLRRPGAKGPAWAMGVDGCPGGWIGVYADMNGLEAPGRRIFETFQAVLDFGAQIIAVDMPIGFQDEPGETGMRACEKAARALLGPRRSSIFPSPLRAALDAADYQGANAANRAAGGKGLSKQSFNIFAKMIEIDRLMAPEKESFVFETHPETSFTAITGGPARFAKKTKEGRAERLDLLTLSGLPESLFHPHPYPRKAAAPDDLVDAGLCLLTALRIAQGSALRLPEDPPRDGTGLRMAIFA